MSRLRQGDIALSQTEDGGNISVINGEPVMDGGYQTAIEISLEGSDAEPHWSEEYQSESEKTRSEFFNFIKSSPKTSANINLAEEKARNDLQWFISDGIADTIIIDITSIDIVRINVSIEILLNGETLSKNEYKTNWEFEQNDPAGERV